MIPVFLHPGEILFPCKQLPAFKDVFSLDLIGNENSVLDNSSSFSVCLSDCSFQIAAYNRQSRIERGFNKQVGAPGENGNQLSPLLLLVVFSPFSMALS